MAEPPLRASADRVRQALRAFGHDVQVVEFAETTRTAAEAAAAIGCAVAQIAKSLIFRAASSGRPVLVIASGANRVNEKTVAAVLGEKLERADADFVRAKTGFAIGGVPPVGHRESPVTFIDEDLRQFDEIWAAAGTPYAVFRLTPADLVSLTGGTVIAIR
ncbi:YbaK/EbsC family protein [Rhodospirillaceae bacterium SYSU D60014]|uniref:YbaK/EbsC family protein n=1 Tax=Virgifigura deserti TaxID=2268457 RepID=UPI000E671A56